MSVTVKICGLRRRQDIEAVNEYRPDYAGFILTGGFRRSIVAGTFFELKSYLSSEIKAVGVFVNEPLEEIEKYYTQDLDVIQLHGDEDAEYIKRLRKVFGGEIWKAVRAKSPADIEYADTLGADRLLIDSFVEDMVGGTGKTADTQVIKQATFNSPFLLAGGIDEQNAVNLAKELAPYGLDISSSVETDGFKDADKIRRIITLIREET